MLGVLGSRKRYNQLLQIQTTSVKEQLKLLTIQLPQEYNSFVLHTLETHADPSKIDDRYRYLYTLV